MTDTTQAPAPAPANRAGPFDEFDTATLTRIKNSLLHPIPGDPTFLANVALVLRYLLIAVINDPARIERDKAAVADLAAAQEKAMADRHEAEQAALASAPPADPAAAQAAKEALDAKHAQEVAAAAGDRAMAELLAKQRADQEALAKQQADERAALTASEQPPAQPAAPATKVA